MLNRLSLSSIQTLFFTTNLKLGAFKPSNLAKSRLRKQARTFFLLSMYENRKEAASSSIAKDDEDEERSVSSNNDYNETLIRSDEKLTNDSEDDDNDDKNDQDILGELRESYFAAQKDLTSKWLHYNNSCYIYLYRGGSSPSSSLAAFDLDGTLIKPKSNKRIPKSATDWTLFSVWTKVKLQQVLREKQASFVIFTNQNGVGLNIVPLEEVQERVELVVRRLNIPCSVFMAVNKDEFRKPEIGMFRLFRKSFNGSRRIKFEDSFYCGDAVGYPSHSDADIKFAKILGLPFLAPEKFLRGVKAKLVEEKD